MRRSIRSFSVNVYSKFFLPPSIELEAFLDGNVSGFFNATFLNLGEGSVAVICRQSYYSLSRVGFAAGAVDRHKTRNYLIVLQNRNEKLVVEKAIYQPDLDFLEDIRIFFAPKYKFCFAVQLLDPENDVRRSNKIGSVPVVGTISVSDDNIKVGRLAIPVATEKVEKNWVFYSQNDRIAIERFPGMAEIFHVDEDLLTLTYEKRASIKFSWSGTQSVSWNGGVLFFDHKRVKLREIFGAKFRYIFRFRFVVENETTYSRPFSIGSGNDVHYVSDLKRNPLTDGVIIAVSVNDAAFSFYSLRDSGIEGLLYLK